MGDGGGAAATGMSNPGSNSLAQALTAGGGLLAAYSQYTVGKSNQRIARDNASIASDQARETVAAGDFTANRVLARARIAEGQQRASQAGSGVIAGAGTGGVVTAETQGASEMDALMIKRNAARAALGYGQKAAADEMEGDAARSKGDVGAVQTLLNTGSQMWLEGDPSYRGLRGSGLSVSKG